MRAILTHSLKIPISRQRLHACVCVRVDPSFIVALAQIGIRRLRVRTNRDMKGDQPNKSNEHFNIRSRRNMCNPDRRRRWSYCHYAAPLSLLMLTLLLLPLLLLLWSLLLLSRKSKSASECA